MKTSLETQVNKFLQSSAKKKAKIIDNFCRFYLACHADDFPDIKKVSENLELIEQITSTGKKYHFQVKTSL